MSVEVVQPTSAEEAVEAFGDGGDVTVIGGGTVVMPDLTYYRRRPTRVVLLTRSGLAGIERSDGRVTIGSMTSVAALLGGDEPLATAARGVADFEVSSQATVGGNLCTASTAEFPRGDLQAPLIALGAQVRSTGGGGERSEPVEEFLAASDDRLVLDVSYPVEDRVTAYASARRPHAHHYTILAASAVRTDSETRIALTGAGPKAVRCTNVEEAVAGGASIEEAAAAVASDMEARDDALASGWYREQVAPTILRRVIGDLEKGGA